MKDMPPMYALVFALALGLAGCSKDKPIAPASKVNPSSDDIISPPGLFPDPGELSVQGLNTVGRPDKFDIAADVLWGSILGTEKKDMTLVRALDGISVLISGVVEIDGREHLYLGIDREDFRKYDIAHLRSVLETRFPDIPIYIEESDGVDLLTTVTEPEETDLFSDDFSDLEAWTANGDWKTETFTHPVPDEETDNTVALIRSTDCSGTCTLTTEPLDLSGYSAGTLSLHRWLDDAMKAGDAFVVQVGNDGVYRTVGSWDNGDGDDVWHYNTFTLNDQDLGEKTTVRITVTMSAFSDLFSLFGGSDKKAEERIAAVDNVLIRGTEVATVTDLPNLVVHDVSVTPGSVESGIPVTVRYSVKNIGTARADKENVSVYRHTSKTRNPTGGTLVNIFAMQSPLEPDAGFNHEVSVETPSVSRDTAVYYYVCVDTTEAEEQTADNCGTPAVVIVKAKKATETPKPDVPAETPAEEPDDTATETPVVTCENPSWAKNWDLIYSRETAMGGDMMLMTYAYGNGGDYLGTISVGGIETKEGVRGFVTAAHNVALHLTKSSLSNTNTLTGQTYSKKNRRGDHVNTSVKKLLGKTFILPNPVKIDSDSYQIDGDAAFIAYPWQSQEVCEQIFNSTDNRWGNKTWDAITETCISGGVGEQIETVVPLTIRGKCDNTYKVTGSEKPKKGLNLWMSGGISGIHDEIRMTSDRQLLVNKGEMNILVYTAQSETAPMGGDSGGPFYTVPDASGEVRIVGILFGGADLVGTRVRRVTPALFTSWESAEKILDLEPIY